MTHKVSLPAFYFNHSQISLSYSVTGDMKEKTHNTSYLPRPEDRFTDLFSNKSSYISNLYHHPLIFPGSGEEGMGGGGGEDVQLTNFKIKPWCRSSWFQMSAVDIDVRGITCHVEKHCVTPKAIRRGQGNRLFDAIGYAVLWRIRGLLYHGGLTHLATGVVSFAVQLLFEIKNRLGMR